MEQARRIGVGEGSTSGFVSAPECPLGARLIPLTGGLFAIVDAADYEYLAQFKWHAHTTPSGRKYAATQRSINGSRGRTLMHRLIAGAPAGMDVDHVNSLSLDNRRANLRICTRAENLRNGRCHRDSAVQYRGVSKSRGRFTAHIYVEKRLRYLGSFATAEDAARAYDAAAIKFFGQFARPNFDEARKSRRDASGVSA